jgi:predicted dinucleotide-binding enzyme
VTDDRAAHRGDDGVIGIFGAGRFGAALARRALAAGYEVRIATSGPVGHTASIVDVAAPGAIASSAAGLPLEANLLLLAVPLHRFRELPLPLLGGHLVIDVMNHWPPVDGTLPGRENPSQPTSVLVRDALPADARLVKTLNHLSHHHLEALARPSSSPSRTAVAVSGDDPDAVRSGAIVVDRLGFDPVPSGDLLASALLEPGSELFGANLDAATLRRLLAASQIPAA